MRGKRGQVSIETLFVIVIILVAVFIFVSAILPVTRISYKSTEINVGELLSKDDWATGIGNTSYRRYTDD